MSDTIYLERLMDPSTVPPPDLTGVNSQYYHADDRYAAYLTGQQIIFDQTLYQTGLVITPDGSSTPWEYGTDWTVNAGDIDTATMTVAAGLLSGFSHTLLKSITILHTQTDLPVFLNMATQSFYPRPEMLPPTPKEDDALTALLETMEERLNALTAMLSRVTNTISGSPLTPRLLAFDINETNSANLITGESYAINTFSGLNTIRPIQGSYFKDSLIVQVNGSTLTLGTDYTPISLNSAKTKITANTGGIYDAILLTYDYAGSVQITYHAVGGEATVSDLNAVYQNTVNIKSFLDGTGFITPDQLLQTPAIQNILNKTCALENQMRVLLSGTPDYGDTTNGAAVVKHLLAPDTGVHWWTIGKLYRVSGTTQIVQVDRMAIQIQLATAMLTADVGITVDLRQTRNPITVNVSNIVQDVQFSVGGSVGTPANVVIPQFRVIWNADSVYASGAYLQIGLNLPGLTETLVVADNSGVESCWILDTSLGTTGTPLTPNDNTVTLPNGTSVWVSGSGTSTVKAKTMPNELGYLIYNGTKSIATFDSTTGAATLYNNLPNWFPIQDIAEVLAEFVDAGGNAQRVYVPMTGTSLTTRRGVAMLYAGVNGGTPVALEVDIVLSSGTITVTSIIHANVQAVPVLNLTYLVAKLSNSSV